MRSGPVHGGPDGLPISHDFSTNASPLGAPPTLVRDLAQADRTRYPDPSYQALRAALGTAHGVSPWQVLPTAGTSEAIRRLTLAARLHGIACVRVPSPGYGDYAAAAQALQMRVQPYDGAAQLLDVLGARDEPALVWICEPCNPTGDSLPAAFWRELAYRADAFDGAIALDRAYEPLRLEGSDPVAPTVARKLWQFFSPNKSLGLTGIRAGYLLAPSDADGGLLDHVEALAPSWVLSAEGVVLLGALHRPETVAWLCEVRAALACWTAMQREALERLGWQQRTSNVPFWLARPMAHGHDRAWPRRLHALRSQGIKLRDARSFGLDGWVRVSAQPPPSQRALVEAWSAAG